MRTARHFLVVAAVVLVAAQQAAAQLAPSPGEVTVAPASNRHHSPAVALSSEGALVVWNDEERGIVLRRFDEAGNPAGAVVVLAPSDRLPPIPFNDRVRREAHEPAIAARADDGSFLAVWVDVKVRSSADEFTESKLVVSRQVVARYFSASGQSLSRPWPLSSLDGVASRPRVALAGERFLVTWQERGGEQPGVHVAAVDRGGPRRDQWIGPRGLRPDIAAGGGGALVTWERCCGPADGHQVFARFLDGAGFPSGEIFKVAADEPRGARAPVVSGQPNGDFLVAYQRALPADDEQTRIYGQLVSRRGALVGGELALSSGYGTAHSMPVTVALADGGWAVGWLSWMGSFRVGVTLSSFDALGNARGNAVDLNDMPVVGLEMALGAGPDGALLAVWEGFDRNGEQGLRARAVRGPVAP